MYTTGKLKLKFSYLIGSLRELSDFENNNSWQGPV